MFSDLELMAFELDQSKCTWLLSGIYKPPSQNDIEFFNRISLIIHYYLRMYENILAIGDFNVPIDNSHQEGFMQAYDFSISAVLSRNQPVINVVPQGALI